MVNRAQMEPLSYRFWSNVDQNGPVHSVLGTRCWVWFGGIDRYGYGTIMENRVHIKTHRLSWKLHYGKITNGLCVLHKCDNPACVNPKHLFLGTTIDNTADRDSKNRQARGIFNGGGVSLTEEQVLEIRRRYRPHVKNGTNNQVALAKEFGVSQYVISQIVRRKLWRHI